MRPRKPVHATRLSYIDGLLWDKYYNPIKKTIEKPNQLRIKLFYIYRKALGTFLLNYEKT